jgi:PAS domain S-box-containing protein
MDITQRNELPVPTAWGGYAIGVAIMALGLSVLAGWAWDIDVLKRVLPGMNTMKANTAASFVFVGVSLLLLVQARASTPIRWGRRLPAVLATLIGLATLAEYVFGWNIGLDQALFRETVLSQYAASPGRMSALTAICFTLLGPALLLADVRRGWAIIHTLALGVAGVSLLALGGNLFGDPSFPNLPGSGAIAIHTAAAFLLTALGILAATSGHGLVARLRGRFAAIGFGLALVVLVVASIAAQVGSKRSQAASEQFRHSHDLLLQLATVSSYAHRYGETNRAYLTIGQESLLQPTNAAATHLLAVLPGLRRLTSGNAAQQERLAALERVLQRRLAVGAENVRIRREHGAAAAAAALAGGESNRLVAEIDQRLDEMQQAEQSLLARQQQAMLVTGSASVMAQGIAVALVFSLLLATFAALRREAAQRKKALLAVEQFKNTLDRTLDCVFMFDGETLRMSYVNQGAMRQVGYEMSELLEMHPYDIKPDISKAQFHELIAPLLAGEQASITFDTVHQHKNGQRLPVEIFLQYMAPEGERSRFIAIVRDITQRRRAEEELARHHEHLEELVVQRTAELARQNRRNELILGTTSDGFYAAAPDGHMADANAAYCNMLGYTREELLQLTIADVEGNESPQDVAIHIKQVIAQGHDRFDTRNRRKDGSLVQVEVSVNLVEIGAERLLFAFVRDITQRKQAEQALIEAKEEAERSSRAKSDFLSRMSHELRTPMNAILGFSQVLEIEPLSAEQQSFVHEIHQAGDHLLELINELLDLSSIEAGRLETAIRPVTLLPVMERALQLVSPLLQQMNVSLLNECDRDLSVLADATRLRQVLVNLLSNAAKYNRHGGSIRVGCTVLAGERVRIAVTDTGPGIAPDKLELLFKPFERLGAEFTAVEGAGIGLAISKRLAELMGGALGVDSTPGQGSTFWIELPLAQAAGEVSGAAAIAAPAVAASDKRKVLYVEDNAANLKVVEALLRRQPNLTLLAASNGEYGLELARRYAPDVILLDIHLPGMDGYAVLKALQAQPETRDIPVIALSADAMPLDVERGLTAGFRHYLAKPLIMHELLETIAQAMAVHDPTTSG